MAAKSGRIESYQKSMKCLTRSNMAGATTAWLLSPKHSSRKLRLSSSILPPRASFLGLLIAVAILAFWAPRAGAAVVLDGGFETVTGITNGGYSLFTGSLGDGWTVTSGEILIERGTLDGIPHSGNQYAYLDGDFALNTLSQTFATTPGQQYIVSFWIADSDPNLFEATFAGQTLYNGPAPASGGGLPATFYVNDTFTVTATSTSSALTFSGQYTSGTGTVLDDVSVVAAPEPSVAILFGAPFLAATGLRSRRFRSKPSR